MPPLEFWPPPTPVTVRGNRPAVIEAVHISRMSWDRWHVEYDLEWHEGGQEHHETDTAFNVTSTEPPIHVAPLHDEHGPPAGDYA
jgi:hypothetical protein